MNNKIEDLISTMNKNKKEFFELFIWDFLSEFFATIFLIITIKSIHTLICFFNLRFGYFFVAEKFIYYFILIWFLIAVITTIISHLITIYTINKNGKGMLIKNEK